VKRLVVLGPATGYHSYPTVVQGLLRGLCAAGLRPAVADISSTGGPHAGGVLDHLDIEWLGPKATVRASGGNVDEDTVLFALNPTVMCASRCVEAGATLVGMHVGDVDMLPAEWVEVIRRETLTVVPSNWLAQVVLAQVPGVKVVVSPHGVGPHYCREGRYQGSRSTLLHFCSSMYYPERKGTPQLLAAVSNLVDRGEHVHLTLVVPMMTKPLLRLLGSLSVAARDAIQVAQRPEGMPPEEVKAYYVNNEVLVAPSRAEGFGMQPLEARACGRPVIQTLCTGMADHFVDGEPLAEWGVTRVSHGELAPAWGDFGRAPTVTVEAVEEAVLGFLVNGEKLSQAAMERAADVASCWSWERTTAALAETLRGLL
jgi:glycosyltransferase involved in cell wall biosynthesis